MNPESASQPVEQPIDVKDLRATIRPKKNCPKCHETGRLGFIDGDMNSPLVCSCVIKIYKKAQAEKATQPAAKPTIATQTTEINTPKIEDQPKQVEQTESANIPDGT